MSKNTDLFFDIINMWAKQNQFYSIQGSVVSVDTSTRTCVVSPTDGGADYVSVRLEADYDSSDSKGFFVVPVVGSLVIITFLDANYAYLSAWTEIDQIVSKQNQWIFNDGANGGLTITPELTTKLNNIENKVNDLILFINTHTHPMSGAPPTPLYTGGNLTPTNRSEIENEDVTH
jgi:hypothetical protein